MKKRRYSATPIKRFPRARLPVGPRVVVAIDVAKEKQLAAFQADGEEAVELVSWMHPEETPLFFEVLGELRGRANVEVVLEPTGTYSDPFAEGLLERGFSVFLAKGKQVHDLREVHDGVPSLHDAKAAELMLHLHRDGATRPWPRRSSEERSRAAVVAQLALHEAREQGLTSMMEARLARHWPEVTRHLSLGTRTLFTLLAKYGSPAAVAGCEEDARALMRSTGGTFLRLDVVEAVLASASRTVGVAMVEAERRYVQELAQETLAAREKAARAQSVLESMCRQAPPQMVQLVGPKLTLVMLATGLDPQNFDSPKALEKAMGLNLREQSSGRHQNRGVHITKRGNSLARQLMYFATLRLVQKDPVVKAWYARKVDRDGGRARTRALVAVMRKLARALWHVARGNPFDASRLFDTARLKDRLVLANAPEAAMSE